MDHQTRASLMSWMDGFTRRFGLAPGTPRRAASYVDRVMSARTLSTTPLSDYELGLLGAAAVFAAAKYEDGSTVSKLNAAGIASYCGFATSKEVIRAEREMLAALRYELGGPTCLLHRHPGQGRRAAGLGDSEAGTSGSAQREQIFAWNGTFGVPPPPGGRSLNDWWDETISHLPKEKKREASGAIIYSMWGVWKERNRRVFQNTALQPTAVAALVKEDIAQRAYAHTQDPRDGNSA
nr:putative cyclin-F1-2 [Lolium perenne]